MRKVVVIEHVTLDGVMQAPGRAEEDDRGGFDHGGWAHARTDEVMGRKMGEGMAKEGRCSSGDGPTRTSSRSGPTRPTTRTPRCSTTREKYVASTTLKEPLPWRNSTLLDGDAAEAVAKLKEQPGKDLGVLGSGQLVRSLMQRGLVDEFVLMIHPLVLGTGRRLFADGGAFAELQLTDTTTTTTGVVIARYRAAPHTEG